MLKLTKTSKVVEIPTVNYNVAQIEYVKNTYPKDRSRSKPVTFALQYFGNEGTLVRNSGFTKDEAHEIVHNYKTLYKVSEDYKCARQQLCCKDGYATVAFGLRVRTPLLEKTILGNSKTLREAEAEARSVGNAMFQSYGLLNNRAAIAFMNKVWASSYKYSIFLVSMIHDAIYLIIKNDLDTLKWVNDNLPQEMSWQELPEIQHPKVKLGAELDVHYPSWAQAITLPNHATREEIYKICRSNQH